MALWIVRAGRHGEFEKKFLDDNRVYLTWDDLNSNLSQIESKAALKEIVTECYSSPVSQSKLSNHSSQIWAFGKRIQKGDWVAVPSKHKPAIHIGEVTGEYVFHTNAESPYFHSIPVKWIGTDIPRSNFDQDILYSFGAFMTVCQVKRNEAEQRVRAMAKNGWKTTRISAISPKLDDDGEVDDSTESDLEQVSRDQIAKYILANFKGHGMARLVDAVLQAQGYTTHLSPPGPDKGIDILAALGPLGFGQPRICVQVKSSDSPLDRPTLDQLIGVMQNVQADQGLLVSWGGFKSTVDKEVTNQFFRVRLWDQNDLINQIFDQYERLDDDLRAELPLKRIWTLTESGGND